MRLLTIFVFGVSTAFSGVCSMAYAEMHAMPMTHVMACEASGEHHDIGMCEVQNEMPCADGTCFMSAAARNNDSSSSIKISFMNAVSPFKTFGDSIRYDQSANRRVLCGVARPPTDVLSSVILRV